MSSILIVDDRPANLRAFEATLAPLGQPIVCASSGQEALKRLLEPEDFAVVLMDVRMPDLDGFETVRMLRSRERTRRIPVIFVSGYTPDDELVIAASYRYGGIADFVLKPFNPDVLRAKVALFVELAKTREEVRLLGQREAERKAAEAERVLRERLMAIIGHDLRNPLSAITVSVQSLLRREHPEPERRILERLRSSAGRMDRLIDDILDFTSVQQGGGLRVKLQSIDLREIVRQAAEELDLAHPERPVAVEVDGDVRLEGDADRLAQVASNLIGNAIQHGNGSGVLVRVRGEEDRVTLQVQNGGEPIPAELRSVIFEPFRRVENGTGTRSVGLGLYIAREIVRAHCGDIEVRSPDDAGKTTFTVRLPKRCGG